MQDEDKRMLEMAMEAARPKWTGDSFSQCQRLVDHTGKIIGEVRRNLAATEWVTPNGDRYISPAAARKAVERAAAIGEGMP